MIFYPNLLIRKVRFVYLLIFVVTPLILSTPPFWNNIVEADIGRYVLICWTLALYFAVLFNFGFLEKMFATLVLSDEEICWKCPLRKTRVLSISQCIEIGAYIENANNGIPSKQIYFSDHINPKKNMSNNGSIKASQHFIKFRYSEELAEFILKRYTTVNTDCLKQFVQAQKK